MYSKQQTVFCVLDVLDVCMSTTGSYFLGPESIPHAFILQIDK